MHSIHSGAAAFATRVLLAEPGDHALIEVRLYNPFPIRPFPIRRAKWVGYLFDFFRLNHRMHDKSSTVNGVATVLGGRNVGDECFGMGPQTAYVDMDVLAAGAIVETVSADFARCWNSASAFPLAGLVSAPPGTRHLDDAVAAAKATPQFGEYFGELGENDVERCLVAGDLLLEWTTAALVNDAPVKTLGPARRDQLLVGRLDAPFGEVEKRLDVISLYLVPSERGVAEFLKPTARGVRATGGTSSRAPR